MNKTASTTIQKTGDFYQDVRAGYYRQERDNKAQSTWEEDFQAYLLLEGVPQQYVSKVSYCAYQRGHSGGDTEILNEAYGLIEIFQKA